MRKPTIALVFVAVLALLSAACGSSSSSPTAAASTTTTTSASPAVIADLAPTGKLRLAVPSTPPFLAHGDPPAGIAVNLATKLAARLGVPLVTTVYDNPPALLAAAQSPGWDVAVLPIVDATSAAVDFAAPVILLPHTLLVRNGSSISTMAEADQTGVTIASVAGDAHTEVLAGQLKNAKLVPVANDAAGLAMLKAGQVDAFADARLAMSQAMSQAPGSHVLTDDFLNIRFGLAVTKGHAAGLAYLTAFAEELKASGAVRAAIDQAHLSDVNVAPAASVAPTTTTTN